MGLEIGDVRKMLAKYDGIDAAKLKTHLKLFWTKFCPWRRNLEA